MPRLWLLVKVLPVIRAPDTPPASTMPENAAPVIVLPEMTRLVAWRAKIGLPVLLVKVLVSMVTFATVAPAARMMSALLLVLKLLFWISQPPEPPVKNSTPLPEPAPAALLPVIRLRV